ncbi:MAG: flagellar assembly protein FliW [Anaerolineae bacterium]
MTAQPDSIVLSGSAEESQPIEFPAGLIGFDEWKHFVVLTHPGGEPLRLLQSLDDVRVSFIIADPRQILADYQIALSEADTQSLQYPGSSQTPWLDETQSSVYCILSAQEEPFSVTANLLGPLVINWQSGLGRQIILSNSGYNPRHPLAGNLMAESATPMVGEEQESC